MVTGGVICVLFFPSADMAFGCLLCVMIMGHR